MKVKVLYDFNDLKENKKRIIGEEFECDVERAQFLIEKGAVEEVKEEIKEEPKEEDFLVEEKPKKKKRKN